MNFSYLLILLSFVLFFRVTVSFFPKSINIAYHTEKNKDILRVKDSITFEGNQNYIPVAFQEMEWNSDKVTWSMLLTNSSSASPIKLKAFHSGILTSIFSQIGNFFRQAFLPNGYPSCVPPEYTTFQIWNIIQDLCSYLRGIMSTHAILEGMGVGRADVTTVQATIQWILRDGASMLGGLLFTSLSSANFGQNVKSWRLFADFINNIGITLDMLAPVFRKQFLLFVCTGSICKALCGIAAGASGAAIAEHWGGKNGNIADVLAKNGAQHTALSLIGLAISVKFAKFANSSPQRIWSLYCLLTIIHMVSNYQAMRVLSLRSLNTVRLDIIIKKFITSDSISSYLNNYLISKNTEINIKKINFDELSSDLTLQSIAKTEPIITPILPYWKSITKFLSSFTMQNNDIMNTNDILFWYLPSKLLNHFNNNEINEILKRYINDKYIILYSKVNKKIYVSFKRNFTQKDQIKAYLESYLILSYQNQNQNNIDKIKKHTEDLLPHLLNILEKNDWDLNRVQIIPPNARVLSY